MENHANDLGDKKLPAGPNSLLSFQRELELNTYHQAKPIIVSKKQ